MVIDEITNVDTYEDISNKKVKVNVDRILGRDPNLSKRYLKFLEENKDNVFTAELSIKWSAKNYFYVLKEDPTVPKWLFPLDDLIVLDKE